jgi:hypothetical protein
MGGDRGGDVIWGDCNPMGAEGDMRTRPLPPLWTLTVDVCVGGSMCCHVRREGGTWNGFSTPEGVITPNERSFGRGLGGREGEGGVGE